MNDSIFTKIIKGEISSDKVYEDDSTIVILDIQPEAPGHLLVIPKKQINKFYEMNDEDFSHLMLVVKKIASALEQVSGLRTVLKIIGTDVPHVHVHLIPLRNAGENKLFSKSSGEIVEIIKRELENVN